MSEADSEGRLRAKFDRLWDILRKWPEDRVKAILKDRLEREGWNITLLAMGHERGKDLEATKGNRVIHIEAKGEPGSLSNYRVERRSFIGGALMSLISHMNKDNADEALCMAFPDNDYYLRGVTSRVPRYVRNKLRVHALFLNDDSTIRVLLPNANDARILDSFEELFASDDVS